MRFFMHSPLFKSIGKDQLGLPACGGASNRYIRNVGGSNRATAVTNGAGLRRITRRGKHRHRVGAASRHSCAEGERAVRWNIQIIAAVVA